MRYLSICLYLFLFIPEYLLAQSFPKVPADMHDYLFDMNTITAAKVQSRSDWRYILQSGVLTTFNYKERLLKYDVLGHIKEIENIGQDGIIQSILVYQYNSRSLPIIETEFLPTGELIGKTKYNYDQNGYLKEITWMNNNEFIIRKSNFELDVDTKSFIERIYLNPDSVESKIIYFYTDLSNGVLKEVWNYKGEKDLVLHKIIYRNSENKIINEEYRDANGTLTYFLKYNYDTNGYPQDITQLFPNGAKLKKFDYKYNSAGLKTGEVEYNNAGEMIQYRKFDYDD